MAKAPPTLMTCSADGWTFPSPPRAGSRRYAALSQRELPATESLADVRRRLVPYWRDAIAADLAASLVTLVVAHGNSL
jgi:2,3-bisphosphoglycerate-dependent phosphoglycerate mutase